MSILFKSFFMNNWGGTAARKTWLMADKSPDNWQDSEASQSNYLKSDTSNSGFLENSKAQQDWLQTEDGTPDFSTEGEEKFID